MKLSKLLLFAIVAAAVASSVVLVAQQRYVVKAEFSNAGLTSLRAGGFDFLATGTFTVHDVVLRSAAGEIRSGATEGESRFNAQRQELERIFPWGDVRVRYTTSHNRLLLTITTTNTSDVDTIEGVWYQPLTLKLPSKAKEYDGSIPLLADNLGGPGVVRMSFGSGSVVAVSNDVAKPLLIGFPWADNRPESTIFPFSVSTGRVKSYPDSLPAIERPLPPKASDTYRVSLRFGSSSERETEIASDVFAKFGEIYPATLNWPDRRPVGAIFLASSGERTENNPRAWFNDHTLNLNLPSGCADFQRRVLLLADTSVSIMKEMNAQGVITWDIEGAEYTHANYIGDPRVVDELAPEMGEVADEYFARFRNAGLRVGICVRPQQLELSPDRKTAKQVSVADPTQLLIDKIGYAKKRWDVSLIYIDSNVNAADSNPLDVAVIERVHKEFPDILLVPEHSNLRYYAYSAPYRELRQGFTGSPERIRATYSKAFALIYTADGPLDYYRQNLATAVDHGDVLMYRTWWRDPQNEKVKRLTSH